MSKYRKDISSKEFEVLHKLKGTLINLMNRGIVTCYSEYEFNFFCNPLFPIWREFKSDWKAIFYKKDEKDLFAIKIRDFKKICRVARINYRHALRVLFNLSILASCATDQSSTSFTHKFEVKLYAGNIIDVFVLEKRRMYEINRDIGEVNELF